MEAYSNAPKGLLHVIELSGDGSSQTVSWANISDWSSSESILWMHFSLEESAVHDWIINHSGLPEIASSALLSEETRPRTLHRDSCLLLTLRGVNPTISREPDDMISLRIWTDGHRVISTRYRGLESTEQILNSLAEGEGPRSVQELLEVWIDGIVERMKDVADSFEDRVMELEERILTGESEGIRIELSEIRKQLITVRRYLGPQRDALVKLSNSSIPWLYEDHRLRLRETTDRLVRRIEDLDEVGERAVLAQEELLSHISEVMNKRAYVFTVVATIFLPLGFLTGLMGMNVGGMPGVDNDLGFWLVAGLCLAVTLILAVIFRNNRWL